MCKRWRKVRRPMLARSLFAHARRLILLIQGGIWCVAAIVADRTVLSSRVERGTALATSAGRLDTSRVPAEVLHHQKRQLSRRIKEKGGLPGSTTFRPARLRRHQKPPRISPHRPHLSPATEATLLIDGAGALSLPYVIRKHTIHLWWSVPLINLCRYTAHLLFLAFRPQSCWIQAQLFHVFPLRFTRVWG